MKAKYFLSSMVLTALFAACTNDDFETQNQSIADSVLSGRATGELILTASKAEIGTDGADTRIVATPGDGKYGWLWEDENDKIGAILVDYKGGTGVEQIASSEDAYMITNYPFAPNITAPANSADFSTPTAVQEGAYMFYNRYDGQNTERRQLVAEIDRIQKVNAGQEAGLVQIGTRENGGQNFFISPIVDVAIPDESPIQIPVILKSAAAVLNFNFKADLDSRYYGNFKVNKVTLQHVSKKTPFYRTLTVNPKAIAEIQKGFRDMEVNGDKPYETWFKDNGAIVTRNADGSLVDEAQIRNAFDLVANRISGEEEGVTSLPVIGEKGNEVAELTYQLETPYVFNNADQTMNLMVVIPADTYEYAKGGQKYQDVEGGLFLLNVYTSEGIYHAYIGTKTRMFKRGVVVKIPEQTMMMKGGKMNVEPYQQRQEFTVETTEDWNYTIEYLKEHFDDFTGENNTWFTPTINLVNAGGQGTIVVDADHYFPEFPVAYNGNVTLKLEGQSEYKINPENVIFGTGDERPTLNVTNQKTATVLFDQNIYSDLEGTDGDDVTKAIKLVSDANIVVKGGVKVDFELLKNMGCMTIERNLGDSDYNRVYTTAKILGNSQNSGSINVGGTLDATSAGVIFENLAKATITAQSFESGSMDDEDRGRALFQNLVNNGTIVTEVSSPNKGTWGGLVEVKGTLTNQGPINDNGELIVATIANKGGVITLGEDPYAYISIKKGSLTDAVLGGKIVLADATNYEFYNDAMRTTQDLGGVSKKGNVIETTIDSQEEYVELLNNYNRYSSTNQETALSVLNTVYVKSSLNITSAAGNKELKDMTFYLEDATLNVTGATKNLKFGAIYANKGANAVNVNNNASKTITAGRVDVAAGTSLTVGKGVTMLVDYDETNAINVLGNLTNNGWINAKENTTGLDLRNVNAQGRINTYVAKNGVLTNNGQLSQPYSEKYDGDAWTELNDLISGLYIKGNEKGDYAGRKRNLSEPRVQLLLTASPTWNYVEGWTKLSQYPNNKVTAEKLMELLKYNEAELVMVEGYQAIKSKPVNADTYYIYLGGGKDETVITDEQFEEWQKMLTEIAFEEGVLMSNPIIAKTFFFVTENNGTINLSKGEGIAAYGAVAQGKNFGGQNGDFE